MSRFTSNIHNKVKPSLLTDFGFILRLISFIFMASLDIVVGAFHWVVKYFTNSKLFTKAIELKKRHSGEEHDREEDETAVRKVS